jgi:hypothetical protein
VNRTTMYRIEGAQTSPRLDTLRKLARAFGITVYQLMDMDTPPPKPKDLRDLKIGEVIGPAS